MQVGTRVDLAEQVGRLAGDEDDGRNLALLELLEGQRLVEVGRLDLQAERIEQDRGGHRRAAAGDVDVDLLAGELGKLVDVPARQDVDLLVVELGDVADALGDVGVQVLLAAEAQHVRLDDANVDAAQIEQVDDVLHRSLADDRQDAQLGGLVENGSEIAGDADVGAVDAARDDGDSALIDAAAHCVRRLRGGIPGVDEDKNESKDERRHDPHHSLHSLLPPPVRLPPGG